MGYKIALGVNWQGKPDFKGIIERARAADEAGAHSIWVAEAWGRDSFTSLTLLAEHRDASAWRPGSSTPTRARRARSRSISRRSTN